MKRKLRRKKKPAPVVPPCDAPLSDTAPVSEAAAEKSRFSPWKRPVTVFLVAVIVRLLYLKQSAAGPFFDTPLSDSATYHFLALKLLEGTADWRFFFQGVFYPTFLAAVYAVFGPSIVAVKVLQALVGAGTALLTERLGTRQGGARIGWIAGGITALYGPSVFFDGEMLAAGWAAFFAAALLLLLSATVDRPSEKRFALIGIVGGLSVLNRAIFLPFLLLAALWLFRKIRSTDRRALLRFGASAVLGFMLSTAPAAIVNYRHTHHASILPSSGGLNLYLGNNPNTCDTLTIRPGARWQALVNEPVRHGIVHGADKEAYFSEKFLRYIKDDFAGFAAGLYAKTLRLINGREIPRNVDIYLERDHAAYLAAAVWKAGRFGFPFALLFAFAAVGMIRGFRGGLPVPLYLFVGLYGLSVILVFVTARYRIPLIPALSLAAAHGAYVLYNAVTKRNRRELLTVSALFVGALTLSIAPPSFCEESIDLEPERYFLAGNSRIQTGDKDKALTAFNRATKLDPNYFEAHSMLGLTLISKGRYEAATDALSRAVQLRPRSATARLHLGRLLLRRGRFKEASDQLQVAVRLAPNNREIRRLLAVANRKATTPAR